MKTHKIVTGNIYTVCGIHKEEVEFQERTTLSESFVTCDDCLTKLNQQQALKNRAPTNNAYQNLPVQPWYFIETNGLSFLEGCIIKRICRHKQKDGVKDLDKAIDEIEKLKKYRYNQ